MLEVFKDVKLRELEFKCGYRYGDPYGAHSGTLMIDPFKIRFDWNFFVSLLTFGLEDPQIIELKHIVRIGIVRYLGFHILCIEDDQEEKYYFSSRTRSGNKEFAIKIAYLIELYRRMYWSQNEYKGNGSSGKVLSLKRFEEAEEDMSTKSDEDIMGFYQYAKPMIFGT